MIVSRHAQHKDLQTSELYFTWYEIYESKWKGSVSHGLLSLVISLQTWSNEPYWKLQHAGPLNEHCRLIWMYVWTRQLGRHTATRVYSLKIPDVHTYIFLPPSCRYEGFKTTTFDRKMSDTGQCKGVTVKVNDLWFYLPSLGGDWI